MTERLILVDGENGTMAMQMQFSSVALSQLQPFVLPARVVSQSTMLSIVASVSSTLQPPP